MSNLSLAMSRPASTSLFAKSSAMLALGILLAAQPACNRTSGSGAAKDDLALVPKDADVVLMVNLTQARESSLWKKAMEKLNGEAKSKQEYDDFVKKCSFDPLKEVDSIFVAFPQNVAEQKEFAVLIKGKFNPETVVTCMKTTAKEMTDTMGVISPELAADLKRLDTAKIPIDVTFEQGLDVLGLQRVPPAAAP